MFVLVPAEIPKALLAEPLPPALVTALRAHNDGHPGPERIRPRMALLTPGAVRLPPRKERPMNGSTRVREPEFTERVISEIRALLARIPA